MWSQEISIICSKCHSMVEVKANSDVCYPFYLTVFCFFSFYERKYKVFLQLFSHQRAYQAIMKQR